MIQQAQAENKDDAVLGAVKLGDGWVTWTTLLVAMRAVYSSLPEDKPKILIIFGHSQKLCLRSGIKTV